MKNIVGRMIPQYIEGLDSFSANTRIQNLEEFIDRLLLENLDQTLTINKIKQQNTCLIRKIDSIYLEIVKLHKITNAIIDAGQENKERFLQLEKKVNKFYGLQISLTKSVHKGFQQINKQNFVEDTEFLKIEKALRNLKLE